jgi:hypothetical protein
MKKLVVIGVLVLAVIAAFATAGVALAQGPAGPATPPSQNGYVGCGMLGAGGAFRFGPNGQSTVDIAANLFKMTREELVAQLQAGKTILDVAKEKGLTAADVAKAVVDARSVAINEAVKAGRITQAQADQMIETMTENVTRMIESGVQCSLGAGVGCGGVGPGSVGRGARIGGRGGMMGGRWGAQSSNSL